MLEELIEFNATRCTARAFTRRLGRRRTEQDLRKTVSRRCPELLGLGRAAEAVNNECRPGGRSLEHREETISSDLTRD
jgi:hypothetical protein